MRVSEIFAKRGLSVDFGGSYLLPRIVGLQKAKELVLLADVISASEADRMGIVNYVVDPEELDAKVNEIAEKAAAGPPRALAMSKALLNRSFSNSLTDALDQEGQLKHLTLRQKIFQKLRAFKEKELQISKAGNATNPSLPKTNNSHHYVAFDIYILWS